MSNALHRDLKRLVDLVEKNCDFSHDIYRQKFHIMPPVGWLNDPNGLCKFGEYYHVFYQYSPFDESGGVKHWGHFRSKDLINWEKLPIFIYPDQPFDIHGVYSGCTLIDEDKMYVYYTGNVKLDGDYDYILSGREHNTVLVISSDGTNIEFKKLIMKNSDYPSNFTCHVRDPKVFKYQNKYYMVQGGRTKDNMGAVIVFESNDKINWRYINILSTPEKFGYMWECPDLCCIDNMWFLICSPQGVEKNGNNFQNIYSCGYFPLYGDFRNDYSFGEFKEFDFGFDFYAPQTFFDEKRQIVIGWLGMPDANYKNPTIGWQHCLTSFCSLERHEENIYRYPLEEIKNLRIKKIQPEMALIFDLEYSFSESGKIIIRNSLIVEWDDKVLSIKHIKGGHGRDIRKVDILNLKYLRILADTSSVEIFLNKGEKVVSTRYYPDKKDIGIIVPKHGFAQIWEMKSFNFTGF